MCTYNWRAGASQPSRTNGTIFLYNISMSPALHKTGTVNVLNVLRDSKFTRMHAIFHNAKYTSSIINSAV